MNRWRVLSALKEKGKMSKKDIARICDLSIPTVDKILKFYLKKKVVLESGLDRSSGGRRPMLYEFNYRVRYVVGVDFEIPELTLVITDLRGKVVNKHFSYLPASEDARVVMEYMAEKIGELIARTQITLDDVIGIGFGAPAFINQDKITISGKNLPLWKNVPVKKILQDKLNVPFVIVDNDVNLMALSESHHMDYKDKVLVYLALREGTRGDIRMGGGVLVNGEVFRGAHGNAATLRHAYIDFSSGKRGEEIVEELMKIQNPSRMVSKFKDHLLVPMLNAVVLFDPDRVVINASILGEYESLFVEECEKSLKHRLQKLFDWNFRVEMARDRDMPCAKGAALCILQEIFSNPEVLLEKLL